MTCLNKLLMNFFLNCSSRPMLLIVLLSLLFAGCATPAGNTSGEGVKDRPLVAVFPVQNLTGRLSPVREIREGLIARLEGRGVQILDDRALEEVMARHRIRYTAGLDSDTARNLRMETGAGAVLLTSLEYYHDDIPPRISVVARLVSTEDRPEILWADEVGLAGDDAPGLLDLGLIDDPRELMDKALSVLARSLLRYLSEGRQSFDAGPADLRFEPRAAYRALSLEPGKKYTVAIVPFFNRMEYPKNAADIIASLFLKELVRSGPFTVIELGQIREAFLELRIIMQEGMSFADIDALVSMIDTDFILGGEAMEYKEGGTPKVAFSLLLIDRKSKQLVWSSYSVNSGMDGVFFFDFRRIKNAHLLASRMVQGTVDMMVKGVPQGPASMDVLWQGSIQ